MTGPATRRSRDARRAVLLAVLVLVSVVAGVPVPAAEGPSDAGGAGGGDSAASPVQAIETCRTIETPGRYELVADLTEATRACIVIAASDVHLDGAGHTIDTSFEGDAVVVVGEDVSNVTVENLVVDDVQEGIRVDVGATSSVGDLTFRNNEIDSRTRAINVTLSGSDTAVTVDGVTFANNALEAGNEGIAVEINEAGWTVRNLSVRGNDVRSGGVGIDVETYGDDMTGETYEFRNNVVDSGDHGIQLIADGTGERVTDVGVVGNDVSSEIGYRSGVPIRLVANDPDQELAATIADNRLNATNGSDGNEGIFVWADGDGTEASVGVTNNTVGALAGQPPPDSGIRFNVDGENQVLDAAVRNNTVTATDEGVELDAGGFADGYTLRATVADNAVTGASRGVQVEVDSAGSDATVDVVRNRLDVTSEGIELQADEDGVALTATLSDNVVDGATAEGVDLDAGGDGASVDVTVDGNAVRNGETGVDLDVANGNDRAAVSVTDNDLTVEGSAVATRGTVGGIVVEGNRLVADQFGVRNYNTTSGYVDARNNDWGSPDGPSSNGPFADPVTGTLADGEGSAVTQLEGATANVRFDPWTGKSDGPDATPIDSCAVIDEPGHYELTGNVTDESSYICIRITASNVTLDGNGYTVDGVDREGGSAGIVVGERPRSSLDWGPAGADEGIENVTVRNVRSVRWGAGVRLQSSVGPVVDVTVADVHTDRSYGGIVLNRGTNVTVRDSVVRNATSKGILVLSATGTTVRDNRVIDSGFGIDVDDLASGTVLRDNVVVGGDRGGVVVTSSGTVVRNNTVRDSETGLRIYGFGESNVTAVGNTLAENLVGIQVGPFLGASSFRDNVVRSNAVGILLNGAQNHTFEGTAFQDNSGWSLQATPSTDDDTDQSATNNSFTDVTFARTGGEFSFTVTDVEFRPAVELPPPPDGTAGVGVFFRADNTSDAGALDLEVTYDGAAAEGVDESTLSVWAYDGDWTDRGGTADPGTNTVSKRIESFSTFAVLGRASSGGTVEVAVEETNSPVVAGETLRVAATLQNTGDGTVEEEVSLVVGDVVRDTATVTLEPGETTTVELAWATGEGDAGEYAAIVAGGDDTDETAVAVEPPDEGPALSVAIASTNGPVTERDPLVVEATVQNTGDDPVEEEVSLVVGETVRDARTVALEPGETVTVELAWQTESGDAGTYTAAVRGGGDTDATEVSVEPPSSGPDLSVLVEEATSPVTAGETVEVVAVVENGGDEAVSESVTLSVEGEVVDETTVAVGAGERVRVELLWRTTEGDAGERVPVVTVGDASDGTIVRVESSNRAPRVRIARTPQVPAPGEAVTFEAVASDPDGTVESYEWRIDGEVVAAERSFTWTFDGTGRRNVSLVVTDDDGASNGTSEPVDVAVLAVDLWHAPATPVVGESVSLVAGTTLSNPAEARYEWTVEGGETFTTERPYASFAFEDPGRHEVTVAVVGPDGQRETDVVNVTVEGREDDPPETTPAPTTTEPPPTTDPPETTAPPDDRTTAPGTRTTAPPTRTTAPGTTPPDTTATRTPRETTAPESPPTTAPNRRTTAPGTDTDAPATTDRETGDGPSTTDGTADGTPGPSATSDTAAGTDPSDGTATGGTQPSDGEVPGLGVGATLLALVALLVLRRR